MRTKLIEYRGNIEREALAKVLEVSVSMIEKVEKGTRHPSIKLAKRWAKYLKIDDIWGVFFADSTDYMCANKKLSSISDLPPTGTD
jgi:Predicted transcriptional regulators